MIRQGFQSFAGKRILLLQGPIGPFFARLAADLAAIGAEVHKVNFNAGDWLYFPHGALNYRGTMANWPIWLEALMERLDIQVIFLFGDCRPVHRPVYAIAAKRGVEVGVFEEGYIRPDYVTLESYGVNGYSPLPTNFASESDTAGMAAGRQPVGNAFWSMVRYGFGYFTAAALGMPLFPHYVHHRRLSILEALPWIRSAWRKPFYRWRERGIQESLTSVFSNRYFLLPLQVFNDTQVRVHADVGEIEDFIETAMRSFARHAPRDTLLVIKHHPMDRGYRDYRRLIRTLTRKLRLKQKVLYVHDQHLPSLLDHARGVVLINSTVGLSALHHGVPTMVCGTALYDMPGLTYQGELDDFWQAAPSVRPDPALYRRFRTYLIATAQLNGSFYKPLKTPDTYAGLVWNGCERGGGMDSVDASAPRQIEATARTHRVA